MRISADENDVAYHVGAHFAEVCIDGEKLDLCVTADEERGEALCFVRKPDGGLLVEGDGPVRELRRGVVKITFSVETPDWLLKELRG